LVEIGSALCAPPLVPARHRQADMPTAARRGLLDDVVVAAVVSGCRSAWVALWGRRGRPLAGLLARDLVVIEAYASILVVRQAEAIAAVAGALLERGRSAAGRSPRWCAVGEGQARPGAILSRGAIHPGVYRCRMRLERSAMVISGQERVERRLAAILAADVAGYSRLTGLDEEGTHAQLQDHLRAVVNPKIAEHRGRVVKNTGDGLLAEFDSVVDAMRCALEVQQCIDERNTDVPREKRIEFRIGVNVGDVMIDRGDIFGDAVNVAARLEGIAEPGAICLSEDAHRQLRGKLEFTSENMGEQILKNISQTVRVYRVYRVRPSRAATVAGLPLPDKPSIAVLPFQNISGEPEQEYFADGIVEEIVTALSRFRQLFVIARSSSFTYKGQAVDVKQVGRELGVRYVLGGSVRTAGDRVRIAGQLIDASTGAHLWADRFERTLENIFNLQDQVTASVVGAIVPQLDQAEIERAKRKPTENLDAYDYYLRGMATFDVGGSWGNREANDNALRLFYKAIELDSNFAAAYGMAATCFMRRKSNHWMIDPEQETVEAGRLAWQAVRLGQDDPVALSRAGFVLARVVGELDVGAALIDRALLLNPNLAVAWLCSGIAKNLLGEPDAAIDSFGFAMRLNPLGPYLVHAQQGTAFAHFLAGHYDQACVWAKKALEHHPDFVSALRLFAASSALYGRLEEAQRTVAHLLQLEPTLRASALKNVFPFRRPTDLTTFMDGLRKAGLPD
jgi:adenylate cyclase